MKEFTINPLNVLGRRKLNFLPPHLEPFEISYINRREIKTWIDENLKGRYFFDHLTKLENNRITNYVAIAFEDPRETTMFLLGCPYLAKNINDNY
jgi:hypothetical protein